MDNAMLVEQMIYIIGLIPYDTKLLLILVSLRGSPY